MNYSQHYTLEIRLQEYVQNIIYEKKELLTLLC